MSDTTATTPSLLLGAVHEGDELPELRYDVTATTIVLGALAARDWRPMHHDHDFAVNRNGTKDIFLRFAWPMYSGDIAVAMFFVISGFMVSGSYIGRANLTEFMLARLLRIVPAMLVVL